MYVAEVAQLSVNVGSGIVTSAVDSPAATATVTDGGHTTENGTASTGITEYEQLDELPAPSVAVTVTTVVVLISVPAAGD